MDIQVLDHQRVLELLPDREAHAHKGSFGRILLLCGSRGYTGAAALAAMGALRSGAGLVHLAVPECIYTIAAIKLTEAIVFPLASEGDTFSEAAALQLRTYLTKMDAVLIGPGLGQSEGTMAMLETVVKEYQGPLIVDADGINMLSGHKHLLRARKAPTVLTPHPGEFRRIYEGVAKDRADSARELALELGCIVVLKGHGTVITDGEQCYLNSTGNPGMAVGGSGDVLAGMVTSLIGQGIPPLEAAAVSVWLHGAAGDLAAKRLGQYPMLPSDLLDELSQLMK
jgi:NAD(P)H-hydrate epimerase